MADQDPVDLDTNFQESIKIHPQNSVINPLTEIVNPHSTLPQSATSMINSTPPADETSTNTNTTASAQPVKSGLTAKADLREVVPKMARVLENILEDMGVERYDHRVVHILTDVLQRETLNILASAAELAEFQKNKECGDVLHTGNNKLMVSLKDMHLAIQEYLHYNVINPYFPHDAQLLIADTNDLLFSRQELASATAQQDEAEVTSQHLGKFPSSLPPHLPEDVNIHMMIPNWDVGVNRFAGVKEDNKSEHQAK